MIEEALEMVEKLREYGCRGCIHKRYGDCENIKSGDYCDTIAHDAADLMEKMCTELAEVYERESGLNIMLNCARAAAETWERKYDEIIMLAHDRKGV